jgi:hypothetical protein
MQSTELSRTWTQRGTDWDDVQDSLVGSHLCFYSVDGPQHLGSQNTCRFSRGKDVSSGKSAFRRGDILFGKLRPYFHNVAVGPFGGICSTDVMVLRPKALGWCGFALGHVNSDQFIDYAMARSEGTRMPRAKWADVAAYAVHLPSSQALRDYEQLVIPNIERQRLLTTQCWQLERMRDALLPPLLSGEIRVDEGEVVGMSQRCSPPA